VPGLAWVATQPRPFLTAGKEQRPDLAHEPLGLGAADVARLDTPDCEGETGDLLLDPVPLLVRGGQALEVAVDPLRHRRAGLLALLDQLGQVLADERAPLLVDVAGGATTAFDPLTPRLRRLRLAVGEHLLELLPLDGGGVVPLGLDQRRAGRRERLVGGAPRLLKLVDPLVRRRTSLVQTGELLVADDFDLLAFRSARAGLQLSSSTRKSVFGSPYGTLSSPRELTR
jgi:hypothetical protein